LRGSNAAERLSPYEEGEIPFTAFLFAPSICKEKADKAFVLFDEPLFSK